MTATSYGGKGLMGVLTPQANTTVEPEFWALLPPHMSMITARLTSDRDTMQERLIDYTEQYEGTATQFANAPVSVIAAACTGASYMIGARQEADVVDRMQQRHGVPFITAALASVAALRQFGVAIAKLCAWFGVSRRPAYFKPTKASLKLSISSLRPSRH